MEQRVDMRARARSLSLTYTFWRDGRWNWLKPQRIHQAHRLTKFHSIFWYNFFELMHVGFKGLCERFCVVEL